jgi:CheY-like chemotaxis protein
LAGHDVRTAYTGLAALEVAEAFRPNVVLSDIGLPGMSGYEVARRLHLQFSAMRLIAMSGYGQASDIQLAKEAGFELHLLKPVDPLKVQQLLADMAPAEEAPGDQNAAVNGGRVLAFSC